ncbi:hypothetical protein EJ110_NYTH14517 [Nymphaea thermarum]|nr:hypothetical protein EJ110_NYTH14517 [Nymphaea thermarum]
MEDAEGRVRQSCCPLERPTLPMSSTRAPCDWAFYFYVLNMGLVSMDAGGNSGIKKRHMQLTEEMLKANPSICDQAAPYSPEP